MAARHLHYRDGRAKTNQPQAKKALAGQACEVLASPMELDNQAPCRWFKPGNWAGFWLWTW
eukprot:2016050-Amphidinium_carterae.1